MLRIAAVLILVTMLGPAPARAADVQAGRSAAQSKCVQCHEADDWEGEDAPSLESLIRDITAGKVKHKVKISLTAAEIANIAAYWAEGQP